MPQRGSSALQRAAATVVSVAVLATTLAVATPAQADGGVDYEPPVDAPVVDPFRVDDGPYGKGNRGIDYGTAPGTEVRATADGEVVFAGAVGDSRHVTVLHEDGIRTTYSFLDEVRVVRGQAVRQGQVVGTTVDDLHLGARRGDAYFDPSTLFDGLPIVRLVPFDLPPGIGPGSERSAIVQFVGGLGRALAGGARFVRDVGWEMATTAWGEYVAPYLDPIGFLEDQWQYLRGAAHYLVRLGPHALPRAAFNVVLATWRMWRQDCTEPSVEVPPLRERHVAVLVGGLNSTSTNAAVDDVDTDALGYAPQDVVRYSYAGGRIPARDGRGATFDAIPGRAYDRHDTYGDIEAEAEQFADLVDDVHAEAPGVPIDVYAHSMGGLVARRGLEILEERHGEQWVLDTIGVFGTMATPHGGADLATAANMVNSEMVGALALDVLEPLADLDPDSDAAEQLAETSSLIDHFRDRPVLEGLDAVAVGVTGDPVVPLPRTRASGMVSAVVENNDPRTAHDSAPGLASTTRELALALDGRPPTCRGLLAIVAGESLGEGISLAEDALGAGAWLLAARYGGRAPTLAAPAARR